MKLICLIIILLFVSMLVVVCAMIADVIFERYKKALKKFGLLVSIIIVLYLMGVVHV